MHNKLLELSMNNLADEDGDILHIPHGDMPGAVSYTHLTLPTILRV